MLYVESGNSVDRVIKALEDRSTTTSRELCQITGLSINKVGYATLRLRREGVLKHIGINGKRLTGNFKVLRVPEVAYRQGFLRNRKTEHWETILNFMKMSGRPVRREEIILQCNLNEKQVSTLLNSMLTEEKIERISHGVYQLKGEEENE